VSGGARADAATPKSRPAARHEALPRRLFRLTALHALSRYGSAAEVARLLVEN
jgi:hypothetical protein